MKFLLLALAIGPVGDPPPIQSEIPDPPPIEQRVSELEKRLAALEEKAAAVKAKKERPIAKTYEEAAKRAVQEGKPLVVWVGDAVCPACIADTNDEFSHFIAPTFEGSTRAALIVAVPDGRGWLTRIGQVWEWPEGHIATTRAILSNWSTSKVFTYEMTAKPPVVVASAPVIQQQPFYQPQVFQQPAFGGSRQVFLPQR